MTSELAVTVVFVEQDFIDQHDQQWPKASGQDSMLIYLGTEFSGKS